MEFKEGQITRLESEVGTYKNKKLYTNKTFIWIKMPDSLSSSF